MNAVPVPTISIDEEVMFYDTDCGGVVHNIAYLRMIEKARTKLATLMGMALREMASSHLFPVVVRTEIDYRKPAVLGDVITVSGSLVGLQGSRFWVEFEVRRGEAELLITCRQALALVQMPAGRPQRLPELWRQQWPYLIMAKGKRDE
jgi:YbgC/YbaW family acyl-CoA thioester hydrolase